MERNLHVGLKQLAPGTDPDVDIVALHGIDGDREDTWTASNGVLWLRDLLPEKIPNARILTYGYDANTTGQERLTTDFLHEHAMNFVSRLTHFRAVTATADRPIIFVAYSFGGLLLKSALIHSHSCYKNNRKNHTISQLTHDVIFFGTPHKGSAIANLARSIPDIRPRFAQTSGVLLQHLERNSEVLEQQLLQYSAISGQFETKFFYELYDTGVAGRVVPRNSAVVPGAVDTDAIGIHKDHINLIKFLSADDEDFQTVSTVLSLMSKTAQQKEADLTSSTSFALLDQLYLRVLHQAFPPDTTPDRFALLRMILGAILLLRDPISPGDLESLLDLGHGTVRTVLCHLHSVVIIPDTDEVVIAPDTDEHPIRLIHPAFFDFITARCPNADFRIDSSLCHEQLMTSYFKQIVTSAGFKQLIRTKCSNKTVWKVIVEMFYVQGLLRRLLPMLSQLLFRLLFRLISLPFRPLFPWLFPMLFQWLFRLPLRLPIYKITILYMITHELLLAVSLYISYYGEALFWLHSVPSMQYPHRQWSFHLMADEHFLLKTIRCGQILYTQSASFCFLFKSAVFSFFLYASSDFPHNNLVENSILGLAMFLQLTSNICSFLLAWSIAVVLPPYYISFTSIIFYLPVILWIYAHYV